MTDTQNHRDTLIKAVMRALEPYVPADVECLFDMAADTVNLLLKEHLAGGDESK